MFKKFFNIRISSEISRWHRDKIIDVKTREKLLALYSGKSGKGGRSVSKKIPAILIGFAITLLSVGVILFYAANWKAMPPWLKLTQVFMLMIFIYGLSYYFLLNSAKSNLLGRGFLMLGMISFGAGIMLIAQIFHISAHPSNGVFAWAMGVLLMSVAMKERFGYYLSILLFSIWNIWEVTVYGLPNFTFIIIIIIVLIAALYKIKDRYGIIAASILSMFYFYQVTGHWISDSELSNKFLIINSTVIIYLLKKRADSGMLLKCPMISII